MVVEIAIDAVVVEKGQPSANGVLAMRVPAPRAFGLHSITLRDSKRKTIDGAMFLVKPQDEREKQKQ